ncbi:xyloglucan galactosyltransferase KATAMARI1-like protein [Pyrus ussuriensis x Pyrus communis]|uniref:Xyloglucan galactosyltransferase KATAMARI1-like protein n=1 Tax=Pyrus ussuriensis x Pyrus communis TaxID=2448454 RepID=A0A5N5FBK6_9ROSA|nr:xyloglucan galactosyltransferase KATAMARI1-like protein [Pyrus ussuriensis x Pyrus communis]
MEKLPTVKCSQELWFVLLISLALCIVFLSFNYSTFSSLNLLLNKQVDPIGVSNNSVTDSSCFGRYVCMHDDLPEIFNSDLPNLCTYFENYGFGPEIENSEGVLSNKSWFSTNQFLLEFIFHNEMKHYKCLTKVSSQASAVYVPFYAGLDATLHLWASNITVRDASAKQLVSWLARKPEWAKMWGRDHFLVAGRISWDFRRQTDDVSDWGSKLRWLPESMNMTMLSVEGSSWNNDIAIPYLTNFHPAEDVDLVQWQSRMRKLERPYLFTFAGAPRPDQQSSIRGKIIDRCVASSRCKLIDCSLGGNIDCDNPLSLMRVFQSSVYCLQPGGDSYTRRSTFDSILAGCIPVFFHPGAAYSQYLWHLPKNHSSYPVYIPVRVADDMPRSIDEILLGISKENELAIREEVRRLIPNLVYADPRSRLETEDAFDLAIKGILERIKDVRKAIREGNDLSIGFIKNKNKLDWIQLFFLFEKQNEIEEEVQGIQLQFACGKIRN